MSRVVRFNQSSRRLVLVRILTAVIAAMFLIGGLWSAGHGEYGSKNVMVSAAQTADSTPEILTTGAASDTQLDNTEALGVVTCILGLLCGIALATLLFFRLRYRTIRLQLRRSLPDVVSFSRDFSSRGRHRFGILDLNLLRI